MVGGRKEMTVNVLVPQDWIARLEPEAARRGLKVSWVGYGPGGAASPAGAEVFFRPDRAPGWAEALAAAPDVRWLHTTSAGVENLLPLTAPRGIALTESGTVYRIAMGEFVIAQMLFLAKRLGPHWDNGHAGRWQFIQHEELHGRTCGIVGLGPIGLGVAERAAAFGMRVVGCRRSGRPIEEVSDVVPPAGLERLWRESDYVVLACPLTPETRHIVGAAALAAMKPTARLINIARGALVDTDALVAALQAGRLAGAALDVTDPEPPPAGHPLWRLPNVLLTPHNAPGNTDDLNRRKLALFLDNLERYLSGQMLENLVDPARGY
jgi:phosphoglycerate dehydrogenase-like enzyme